VVDHREHLGARAVVTRQGKYLARLRPALAKDLDVGVSERIDGLELVADEEELVAREQVDELALQAIGVLELVDHDRAEAPALLLANRFTPLQEIAGDQLQVLEVERRLSCLCARVRGRELREQGLQ
jgi:hypothetical protein